MTPAKQADNVVVPVSFDGGATQPGVHISDHISQELGEMPASSFFELLFDQLAERMSETVEVEGEIRNTQLDDAETSVQVEDNENLVGDRHVVVQR